jgi:hypothetical protein
VHAQFSRPKLQSLSSSSEELLLEQANAVASSVPKSQATRVFRKLGEISVTLRYFARNRRRARDIAI